MSGLIYKICDRKLWASAEVSGSFDGAAVDHADGYIHFSTADQVRQTAALHFAGQSDLVLAAVETEALGDALKFEPSRGGDLFPHLYGPLPMSAVRWISPLPLDDTGNHSFPDLRNGEAL